PHQLLALSRPLAHPRVRAIHIDARPDETRGRSGFLCLRSRRLADVRVGGNAIAATGTVAILLICVGTTAAFSGWPWRLGDRGPLANLPGASNFQARYYGGVGCKEPYCET